MEELVEVQEQSAAEVERFQLAQWMGRREAFGLVAGRCSAADITILLRIKEEKLYASMNCSWEEFCTRHLHVARRTAEREIGYLREYGPAFFTIRQLTQISVNDYRAITSHITAEGVNVDGMVVALRSDNSAPLAAAVEELLKRRTDSHPAALAFDIVLKRCQAATRSLRSFQEKLDERQKLALADYAIEVREAATALGVQFSN